MITASVMRSREHTLPGLPKHRSPFFHDLFFPDAVRDRSLRERLLMSSSDPFYRSKRFAVSTAAGRMDEPPRRYHSHSADKEDATPWKRSSLDRRRVVSAA